MYWVGKLKAMTSQELLLEKVSWVAWTSRFSETSKNGNLDEVEKIDGPVIIGRNAVVDAIEWKHNLPIETK